MPGDDIPINSQALSAAADAVGSHLGTEAADQQAYLHSFADGRISLELEWIDPADLARTAVTAYLRYSRDHTK